MFWNLCLPVWLHGKILCVNTEMSPSSRLCFFICVCGVSFLPIHVLSACWDESQDVQVRKRLACFSGVKHRLRLDLTTGKGVSFFTWFIFNSHLLVKEVCAASLHFTAEIVLWFLECRLLVESGSLLMFFAPLHALSINACGIVAWALHCKQNSIYACETSLFFFVVFFCTCR